MDPKPNITGVDIEDFIGIFDTDLNVQPLLDYYQAAEQVDLTIPRRGLPNRRGEENAVLPNARTDSGFSTHYFHERERALDTSNSYMLPVEQYIGYVKSYCHIINECFEKYSDKYEELKGIPLQNTYFNIQKTMPGEGYHVWHSENTGPSATRRVLGSMLYLNDDFEGGETEFLYQSRRVTPKTGRVVIWPAHFTHVHRGNPPLSNEKFIATGWIEFIQL